MIHLWFNLGILLLNILFVVFVKKISSNFIIYDFPDNKRKIHSSPTPLIGGIILYLNISLNLFIVYFYQDFNLKLLLILASLYLGFFIIGFIDDKLSLSATKKTFAVLVILLLYIPLDDQLLVQNLVFNDLDVNVYLNKSSIFFTILSLYFFYNFVNFSDGANGITLSLCIFWTIIFLFKGSVNEAYLISILASLLIVFLFNINENLFIGNSGSSFLSIIFGTLFIINYNLDHSIKSDEILLLVFLPAIDSIRVTITRILNSKSPFKPDNKHFHHLLLSIINKKIIFIPYILFASLPYLLILFILNTIYIFFIFFIFYLLSVSFLNKKKLTNDN